MSVSVGELFIGLRAMLAEIQIGGRKKEDEGIKSPPLN